MKLYGGGVILPGLVVFLILATLPLWFGAVAGAKTTFVSPPNPAGEQCIESRAFMRDNHMRLLYQWRDDVVRSGDRVYVASDGRHWNKSLARTCGACHGQVDANGVSLTAATACDQCHAYVGVSLYCWDCHDDPAAHPLAAPALPFVADRADPVSKGGQRHG